MRRIGILQLEEAGWQKQIYVWDVRSLEAVRAYAAGIAPWLRVNITEIIWCQAATVHYNPALAAPARRVFTFVEPEQRETLMSVGNAAAGWTTEEVLRGYFRQASPYLAGTKRQASIVAPVAEIFDAAGHLLPAIGDQWAFLLRQATGIVDLQYTTAALITYPQVIEDR